VEYTFEKRLISTSVVLGLLMASPALMAGGSKDQRAMSAAEIAGNADVTAVTDAYREGQIWATYVVNPKLNSFDIKVDVNGERAILTGNVESAIDKRLAERIAARTDGIKQVDNRIMVDPTLIVATVVETEPTYAVFVADATVESMIESKLLWNEYTDALDINVQSSAGIVTLTGKADTENSKALAAAVAATTPGVVLVNNLLTLDNNDGVAIAKAPDGDNSLSDTWIAAKVESTLEWDTSIDNRSIDIAANNGVVQLTGEVGSVLERRRSIEAAQSIRGVKRVDASSLSVSSKSESVATADD